MGHMTVKGEGHLNIFKFYERFLKNNSNMRLETAEKYSCKSKSPSENEQKELPEAKMANIILEIERKTLKRIDLMEKGDLCKSGDI